MRFEDIPINLQLKERLIYLAKSGQVPHAQLFWGPPGSASLTLAIAFATYLHCNNKLPQDSCGVCSACMKMDKLTHPDIKFAFPINTSKTTSDTEITSNNFLKLWYPFVQQQPYAELSDWTHHIGAEHKQLIIPRAEATYINQYISLQSFEGGYKIIIIWLPEYLHPTAANAMLKILEDPPQQTIFLLVSMMPDKILNTLQSRLQQMYVPAFTDEAVSQLILRDHKLTAQKLAQIVGLAEGNLNKAYKLIEETNDEIFEEFKSWMRVCYAQDFTKLMAHVERFQESQKENQKSFLTYVLYMMRQITLVQCKSEQLLRVHEQERELTEKLAPLLHYELIKEINMWLGKAYYHIDRNLNPKILFLNLSLKMAQIFKAAREKAA
jgi:DNA polymerase-3 subunit delta'